MAIRQDIVDNNCMMVYLFDISGHSKVTNSGGTPTTAAWKYNSEICPAVFTGTGWTTSSEDWGVSFPGKTYHNFSSDLIQDVGSSASGSDTLEQSEMGNYPITADLEAQKKIGLTAYAALALQTHRALISEGWTAQPKQTYISPILGSSEELPAYGYKAPASITDLISACMGVLNFHDFDNGGYYYANGVHDCRNSDLVERLTGGKVNFAEEFEIEYTHPDYQGTSLSLKLALGQNETPVNTDNNSGYFKENLFGRLFNRGRKTDMPKCQVEVQARLSLTPKDWRIHQSFVYPCRT